MINNEEEKEDQKLFTNMVVHDLRTPAEAINGGLQQAQLMMKNDQQEILNQTEKQVNKEF